MKLFRWFVVGMSLSAAGCASSASNIGPSYVSPIQFQDYSCRQIGAEAGRISQRVSELTGVQDGKATSDAVVTTVAIVVFLPVAFMLKGDGQTGAELARVKGEFEALQKVSIQKNCNIQFKQAPKPKKYKHKW